MTPDLRMGAEFARYRLEAEIGRGGTGTVYRAVDLDLQRVVALKVLDPRVGFSQEIADTLALEADLLPALRHPNVIPVYAAGELDGLLYIAMPLIEGSDLAALIRKEAGLDLERTGAIVDQVAAGLDAAHEAGLVHRDVKPQNVLVFEARGAEHVQLTDFGLAMDLTGTGHFSASGHFLGSLHYAAPEQIKGGRIDGRTDVYGLGCLVYECLTGQVPFPRRSGFEVLWAQVNELPPKVSATRPEIPEEVDRIIHKATAKRLEERFLTAGEVAGSLRRAAGLDRQHPATRTGARSGRSLWSSAPRAYNPALEIVHEIVDGDPRRKRWLPASGIVAITALLLLTAAGLAREPRAPSQVEAHAGEGPVLDLGSADVEVFPEFEGERAGIFLDDGPILPRETSERDAILRSGDRGSAPEDGSLGVIPEKAAENLPLPHQPSRTPVEGSNGAIAFDDGKDVWMLRDDGRPKSLTKNIADADHAVWASDGSRVAVTVGRMNVIIMKADGSNPVKVADGAQPTWSPDGTKIVFVNSWLDGGVAVVDANGRTKRILTRDEPPFYDRSPDWSPDGSRIAFVRGGENGAGEIYVMNADGTAQRRITVGTFGKHDPDWSPDGSHIAFSQKDAGGMYHVYVMDPDGSDVRRITPLSLGGRSPEWSPDGRLIVFESDGELYVISPSGTGLARITDASTGARNPAWRPRCTVRGTPAADILVGADGPDLICGLGGNDVIRGRGGDDVIFGGDGSDRIFGGTGWDTLVGGRGRDRLDGGSGRDSCVQGRRTRCE